MQPDQQPVPVSQLEPPPQVVRAKFQCLAKTETASPGGNVHEVTLEAITTGDEDDRRFWEATPSGTLKMQVLNPDAAATFVPGERYVLDFRRIEPADEQQPS